MNKSLVLFLTVLTVFVIGCYVALQQGRKLNAPTVLDNAPRVDAATQPSPSLLTNLQQNLQDPLTRLFIQLIVIVLAARVCGAVARCAGQPSVIGEMFAGLLLGPSLLGWLIPAVFSSCFPPTHSAPCAC